MEEEKISLSYNYNENTDPYDIFGPHERSLRKGFTESVPQEVFFQKKEFVASEVDITKDKVITMREKYVIHTGNFFTHYNLNSIQKELLRYPEIEHFGYFEFKYYWFASRLLLVLNAEGNYFEKVTFSYPVFHSPVGKYNHIKTTMIEGSDPEIIKVTAKYYGIPYIECKFHLGDSEIKKYEYKITAYKFLASIIGSGFVGYLLK